MTFSIPDEVGKRFKEAVPASKRSKIVAALILARAKAAEAEAEAVCRRVNKLKHLEKEMGEWERFDDQEA